MLTEVCGNGPEIRVLDFLIDHVGYDYTLTDISRETGVSRPTLYKMWKRFKLLGIIRKTRQIGNAQLYQLDDESQIVKKLEEFDFSITRIITERRSVPDSIGLLE